MSRPTKNLLGQTFNRLYVVEKDTSRKRTHWLCRCSCGATVTVEHVKLYTGHTKSCGCWKIEATKLSNTTHGHSLNRRVSKTYKAWSECIQRCTNPKSTSFKYYGARGISVCDNWKQFEAFLKDMGECPPERSLDRINVNENYCKENCRWATREEQFNNKRNTKIVEYKGSLYPIRILARKHGLPGHVLYGRMRLGWSIEKAITTPVLKLSRTAQ